MKKRVLSIIFAITLLFLTLPFHVFANHTIRVYLDNEEVQFDVAPLIIDGRTMVPMRAIFEKLGATVTWDENTSTAHAYNEEEKRGVSITIGALQMFDAYMREIPLDVPAIIENGRTLVPLRAVSEAFECDVRWDGDTSTITIFSENFIDFSKTTETQEEIRVSTAEQLLNNIGSNKKIILTSNYYNLSYVENINNEYVVNQYDWDCSPLDAYMFKDIVNMTIEGNAEIVIDDEYCDVLWFENCKNITLSGLTIGHATFYEEYACEGAVTQFMYCDDIYFKNCSLFGCGSIGIDAYETTNINIANSKIYDCTYTAISLSEYSSATVTKTDFFDSVYDGSFLSIWNSNINCTDCNIYNIVCKYSNPFIYTNDFSDDFSNINFTNCSFKNNTFDAIANDDGDKQITFNNCIFENNIGDMNHSSVVHNNSTFSVTQETKPSGKKSTMDDKTLFLKYVRLGVNCQTDATKNVTNYIKYDFDERFITLFFDNLRTGYQYISSAYEMSLEYSDMNETSASLKNILTIYEEIFDGKHSPTTIAGAFTKTSTYYADIIKIAETWLQ